MTYTFKIKTPDQIDIPRICRENKDKDGFVISFGNITIFAVSADIGLNLNGKDVKILKPSQNHWPIFLPNGTLHFHPILNSPVEVELFRFTCTYVEDSEKRAELITGFFKALTNATSQLMANASNLTAVLSRRQRIVKVISK